MKTPEFLKTIYDILFFFTIEQRFSRRLPSLNQQWIYLIFRYCEKSPLPFGEIFDDVQKAILNKDFAMIFRAPEGWDVLLTLERQWYSEQFAKKFLVEDHCFAILKIVFMDTPEQRERVFSKLKKIGGNQ